MPFTDEEILLLLELDFDLPEAVPTRWARIRSTAWWLTVAFGSVAVMFTLLHYDYGFRPPHFPA